MTTLQPLGSKVPLTDNWLTKRRDEEFIGDGIFSKFQHFNPQHDVITIPGVKSDNLVTKRD